MSDNTPTNGSDMTLPGKTPMATSDDVRFTVVQRIFALPPWAVVTIVVAGMLCLLANRYLKTEQTQPPPTPVEINLVQPPPVAEEVQAVGATQGRRLGPARRFFVDVIRRRLADRLQQDGFSLIGKDPTPFSAAKAEELVGRLNDEQIVAGAIESGAVGDGKLLDKLGAIVEWLVDHQDQILLLLKFLLTLLSFA